MFRRRALLGLVAVLGCGSEEPLATSADSSSSSTSTGPSIGECSLDEDCVGRAEVCGAEDVCVPKPVDTSSTQDPAPSSFSGVVPFHRGQACVVDEVRAGEDVPMTLEPCLHPCLEVGTFSYKTFYSCVGEHCDAWVTMYVEATSVADGCPPDAFGQFDRSLCTGGSVASVSIGTTGPGAEPVEGGMTLEIPFLSNADAQAIAASGNDTNVIQEMIDQYPLDEARIVTGGDIVLSADSPQPPASCESGCTCYDVGF